MACSRYRMVADAIVDNAVPMFDEWPTSTVVGGDVAVASSLHDNRRGLPILHQTVSNLSVSVLERSWRESWLRLGFRIRTADDVQARCDVERLVRVVPSIIHVYDGLETAVQRADVWRYAILWLEGGVYADIDVVAHLPIVDLVRSHSQIVFSESLSLFDYLPRGMSRYIGEVLLRFGLTDLVRLPQRRNCVMVSPSNATMMLRTLQMIVAQYETGRGRAAKPEPTRTLELTGPGILTDAINSLVDEGSGPVVHLLVHRFEGWRFFRHIGTGSWKTYGENVGHHRGCGWWLDDCRLKVHERTVLVVVLVAQLTLIAMLAFVCRRCVAAFIRRMYN